MKKLLKGVIVLVLVLFCVVKSNAQCSISVPSTNGYNVNIDISITSILVNPNGCGTGYCLCGYVYNYVLTYNVTFSGINIPSGGLYTLQGYTNDGNGNSTFDLPDNGGSGTVTSANKSTLLHNCSTVNTSYFSPCVNIIIFGPNLSNRTLLVPCSCVALPIELIDFTGKLKDDKVLLEWSTAMEFNNDYFLIERTSDLIYWETIAEIKGKGNSNSIVNYKQYDNIPSLINYYRLMQVDIDGTATYSKIVSVNLPQKIQTTVYPNPTKSETIDIKVISQSFSNVQIIVYDMLGRIVVNRIVEKNDLELTYNLGLPKSKDMYMVFIIQDNVVLGKHSILSE